MAMTEEHKKKMAAGRKRAAEQKKAEAAAAEAEAAEQARIEAEMEKVNPSPTVLSQEPDRAAVAHGGQVEWGPFDTFQEVHTPYGLYGLPKGMVMHFEPAQEMLHGELITTHKPIRRKVVPA